MKLNIGCGHFPLEGYTNIDAWPGAPANLQLDVFDLQHEVPHWVGGFEEVRMDHVLEHFSWHRTGEVLSICRWLLRSGGILHVEVPDMERIMAGETGPVGFVQAIYGAQDHAGEYHHTGFVSNTLSHYLSEAGFEHVEVTAFTSDHPMRPGFPCLLGRGRAP